MTFHDGGAYHVCSRIVDRRFIFGSGEKDCFVTTMRKLEAFLEVKVLTYCVMSNHFHLLLEVPSKEEISILSPQLLRERLPLLYHGAALAEAIEELDRAEAVARGEGSSTGTSTWLKSIVSRYQRRMGDLSVFMKELKWRFSIWYNNSNDRAGTLWENRFHSTLIEGDEHALMTVAAYIELNPIRAQLVSDPKDYRWCGYAEAFAGKKLAQQNLARLHNRTRAWQGVGRPPVRWQDIAAAYRVHLFGHGEQRPGDGRTGAGARAGIPSNHVEQVIEKQRGQLPLHQLLRSRVRYFTHGAAIGSSSFVEGIFNRHPEHFASTRKTGARKMRGGKWGGLSTLRDLRNNVAN